ncbi:MAG: hypothetical protein E7574_02585 [Ruminococcaceae bacterium]|nr:hypothetical protein [Oscillospiraceae bacterium]
MKRINFIVFCLLFCITLVSCTPAKNNNSNDIPPINNDVTPPLKEENNIISDKLNSDEQRQFVVDYIRAMADVEWTPEKTFLLYGKYQAWSYNLTYEKGKTYYGLPFLVDSRGTKQEFLNSIVDGVYVGPTSNADCIGDACYDAVYVTLIQVCPSITFKSTEDMLPKNETGLAAVGDWDWSVSKHDTPTIMNRNTLETMSKAYAQLNLGDVVLKHVVAQDAGHTRIISKKPVVVYKSNGEIDPDKSYVTTLEQTNVWDKTATRRTTWYVDHTYTFSKLYESFFVPLTPVDYTKDNGDPYISSVDLLKPEDTAKAKRLQGELSSNNYIMEVGVEIKNKSGEIIYSEKWFPSSKTVWLEDLNYSPKLYNYSDGTYNFTLYASLATGTKTITSYDFELKF